jgi:hypothetical protein
LAGGIAKPEIMKTTVQSLIAALFVAASLQTNAQGTLVFDQQSANSPVPSQSQGVDFFDIQTQPLTQSFIPSLSAIGFAQFAFWDIPNNGNNGATVYVNLWSGSPNINLATLLGSTTPVYMPNGFGSSVGVTNFYFPTPIALTSGQTYYLQPFVLSGDNPWSIMVLTNTYPNGQLYGGGGFTAPFQPTIDLWFREGIVSVPEPTTLALIGLGGLVIFIRQRRSLLRAFTVLAVFFFYWHPVPSTHSTHSHRFKTQSFRRSLTKPDSLRFRPRRCPSREPFG